MELHIPQTYGRSMLRQCRDNPSICSMILDILAKGKASDPDILKSGQSPAIWVLYDLLWRPFVRQCTTKRYHWKMIEPLLYLHCWCLQLFISNWIDLTPNNISKYKSHSLEYNDLFFLSHKGIGYRLYRLLYHVLLIHTLTSKAVDLLCPW